MGISFSFSRETLRALLGKDFDFGPESEGPAYIYKHLNNGSGICVKCAPWLNMRTAGNGSDGVPVPPLHPNCKCYLLPLDIALINDDLQDVFGGEDGVLWQKHFEWLKSLPTRRLAEVVGEIRARLVQDGVLTVEDLYVGGRLRSLESLGFTRSGERSTVGLEVNALLSDSAAVSQIVNFRQENFDVLPVNLQGNGPSDMDAGREMVMEALLADPRRSHPGWLLLLIALIEALKDDGD